VAEVIYLCNSGFIKASEPKILTEHFWKLGGVIRKPDLPEDIWFSMDEKGFMIGKSGRCNVICGRGGRGMTAKLAQDGNKELIRLLKLFVGIGQYYHRW